MGVWALRVILPHLLPPELANVPPRGRLCHTTRFPKEEPGPEKLNFLRATAEGGVKSQTRKLITTNSGWAPKPWVP